MKKITLLLSFFTFLIVFSSCKRDNNEVSEVSNDSIKSESKRVIDSIKMTIPKSIEENDSVRITTYKNGKIDTVRLDNRKTSVKQRQVSVQQKQMSVNKNQTMAGSQYYFPGPGETYSWDEDGSFWSNNRINAKTEDGFNSVEIFCYT